MPRCLGSTFFADLDLPLDRCWLPVPPGAPSAGASWASGRATASATASAAIPSLICPLRVCISSPGLGSGESMDPALRPDYGSAKRLDRSGAGRGEGVAEVGGVLDAGREGGGAAAGSLDRPVHPVVVLLEPEQAAKLRVLGPRRFERVGDPFRLGAAVLGRADLADDQRLARRDRPDDAVVGGAEEVVEAAPLVGP